eukprot:1373089-Prorocentrum_lima.AAC.1
MLEVIQEFDEVAGVVGQAREWARRLGIHSPARAVQYLEALPRQPTRIEPYGYFPAGTQEEWAANSGLGPLLQHAVARVR